MIVLISVVSCEIDDELPIGRKMDIKTFEYIELDMQDRVIRKNLSFYSNDFLHGQRILSEDLISRTYVYVPPEQPIPSFEDYYSDLKFLGVEFNTNTSNESLVDRLGGEYAIAENSFNDNYFNLSINVYNEVYRFKHTDTTRVSYLEVKDTIIGRGEFELLNLRFSDVILEDANEKDIKVENLELRQVILKRN